MFLTDYRVIVQMSNEIKYLDLRAKDAVECVKNVREAYGACGPIKVQVEPAENPSLVVGNIQRRKQSFVHRCI